MGEFFKMPEITKLAIFPLITDTGVNLTRGKKHQQRNRAFKAVHAGKNLP